MSNKSTVDFNAVKKIRAAIPFVRNLDKGMGLAVARRTVFRPSDEDDWGMVAARVAIGNSMLTKELGDIVPMAKLIATGGLLMSGRHLQHGDADQHKRNLEVFSNCSTAAASFSKFYLLLNGSGVGRSYDDQMMLVDWTQAPQLKQRLSKDHPDFPSTPEKIERMAKLWELSVPEAEALVAGWDGAIELAPNTTVLNVEDSREGWAHALEAYEVMTFNRDPTATLMIVWSAVRAENTPIGGMQDRPASGPIFPMRAFNSVDRFVRGKDMEPWLSTMWVDHFFSREVQVGGARRAARIAVKYWKDPGIIDFVFIKSRGGLWTANNSVGVDKEFWDAVIAGDAHATAVFNAVIECSYQNGEPGFINLDQLVVKGEREPHTDGSDFRSDRFESKLSAFLLAELSKKALSNKYPHIVNPCGEISLHLLGAYCVIADIAPALCFPGEMDRAIEIRGDISKELGEFIEWDANVVASARMATRALIRANTMPALYSREVARTNRIGVGMTGVHEFAWLRFGLTFEDICEETPRSLEFWNFIDKVAKSVVDEARTYAKKLGVEVPHTTLTMKPAGTTSKLFGLTEGAHLASMQAFLRWVQFRGSKDDAGNWIECSDPLLAAYESKGYPVRVLSSDYAGMSIVGFPTIPLVSRIGMPWITTAYDATPTDQYKYLRMLEKFWLQGDMGNQVSYTLKINVNKVSMEEYRKVVLDNQSTVRCCSVLPERPAFEMNYEYLPEEPVTLDAMVEILSKITDPDMTQEIDIEALRCATGACPM